MELGLTKSQYAAIAAFRYELRCFLAFSEAAAASAGLPPQQHQALLAIAGHVGLEPPSVGDLAKHLLIAPHTAAELVSRMSGAGLVSKTSSERDRRRMNLSLTAKSEQLLGRLTASHLKEIEALQPSLQRILEGVAARS